MISTEDSIIIQQETSAYNFIDCLEMLNGNFMLFYQIKPEFNKKTKGEIDYLIILTQKLTVTQKLNEIFNFKSHQDLRDIVANNYSVIEDKCDIAFKIGLSRRDVFLELWNKSGKTEVDDFNFLLDTLDYDTIKAEIEKKLKKSSMLFREVYKLEQSCIEMLQKDVFGTKCSEKSLKNYMTSHFLIRKLEFFRDKNTVLQGLRGTQDDENKKFTIDIQQYFNCVNLELKSNFLELAFKLCFEDKEVSD